MENYIITIDGPASAGKSSIGKIVAKKLNISFLSTGHIYRALALKTYELGLNVENVNDCSFVVNNYNVKIVFKEGQQHTLVNGEDYSSKIQTEFVGMLSSKFSVHKIVRDAVNEVQQETAKSNSIVVEGRDIGSVIFPNANYKFYMDASVEIRAERRYLDLKNKGYEVKFEEVLEELKKRDYNDTHRENSPLVVPENAIIINTDNLTIDEVVNTILTYIK